MPPSNEDLQAQLKELSLEVRALRAEVERLKGGEAPAPAAAAPAPAPAAAPREEAKPAAAPPAKPRNLDELMAQARAKRPAGAFSSFHLDEKFIGEKVLPYLGAFLLALGAVFFLIWRAAHTGPAERALMAAAAGAALVALGVQAAARPAYEKLAVPLYGAGWSVLYATAYAVYHFAPTKCVESPVAAMGLLLGAAGGMIAHAVRLGARPFRLYAFSLVYLVLAAARSEVVSFDLFVILLGASALVAVESGEADVLLPSLAGFHLHYLPVYLDTIATAPERRTLENFVAPFAWLAGAYLIVALLPLIPRARARLAAGSQATLFDAALCLNAVAFAVVAGSMGRVYFGHASLPRAAALSALFLIPGAAYARLLPRRTAATGIAGVLAAGLVAAAVFEMPDPMWKLFAWVGLSTAWVFAGLFLDQSVWRAAGLCLSTLTFFFYLQVARESDEARRAAAMALFLFAGLSYFFSRFHRLWLDDPEEWEKPSTEYWLHTGSAALILALWGTLDAAPFLCALAALAVAGELLAVKLGRVHLWAQVSALELSLGAYSFLVDYGPGASWGVPPRLLVNGVVAGVYAWLLFDDPSDEALCARWTAWSRADQRRAIAWLMTAVLAFAVYKDLDGAMRLPVWAFAALGLHWLGRVSREDFKTQGTVLAFFAAIEAFFSYIAAPRALLPQVTAPRLMLYWGSVGALLGGLWTAKLREGGAEPTEADRQAAKSFAWLALVMGAAYFAKELDRVQLTLAWTGWGIGFLAAGLALEWRELRLPGLWLLGLCAAKALLYDLAGLPLPYRVASFVALGAVLLFASSLYGRAARRGEP